MEKLRFAPLCRVSTEKQEDRGESLALQRKQIQQAVNSLGGVVPDQLWTRYSGQEHGTENYDREKLELLLSDAAKDVYDALIITTADRWSRDNVRSETGLQVLRDNGKDFYIASTRYDLYDPEQLLFINLSTTIGQFIARQQKKKSIESRIERAKQNRPSAGKKPFGRTWSESEGWGIDPVKHELIQSAARRYLQGEYMPDIAASLGVNASGLMRTLKNSCADKWQIVFDMPDLNISESVDLSVPRLLPDETIAAIHRRAELNKTYTATPRAKYPLSKYVFCSRCGYAMHSSINGSGKRYYRHATHKGIDGCEKFYVSATDLETAVLMHLKNTLGDPARVRRAIDRANPNREKQTQLLQELAGLEKSVKELDRQKDNVIDSIAEGVIDSELARTKIEKFRTNHAAMTGRIGEIKTRLSDMPSPEHVKRLGKLSTAVLFDATRNPDFTGMASADIRRLVEKAFNGVDGEGLPLGIYVTRNSDGGHVAEIRGIVENTLMSLPLTNDEIADLYRLDSDYCDIDAEAELIRTRVNQSTRH